MFDFEPDTVASRVEADAKEREFQAYIANTPPTARLLADQQREAMLERLRRYPEHCRQQEAAEQRLNDFIEGFKQWKAKQTEEQIRAAFGGDNNAKP